jgi:hypothetical protein
VPVFLSEKLAGKGDGARGLADPRAPGKEEVGEVALVHVGLEALGDVGLTDDIRELSRAVLLDPDFLQETVPPMILPRSTT